MAQPYSTTGTVPAGTLLVKNSSFLENLGGRGGGGQSPRIHHGYYWAPISPPRKLEKRQFWIHPPLPPPPGPPINPCHSRVWPGMGEWTSHVKWISGANRKMSPFPSMRLTSIPDVHRYDFEMKFPRSSSSASIAPPPKRSQRHFEGKELHRLNLKNDNDHHHTHRAPCLNVKPLF